MNDQQEGGGKAVASLVLGVVGLVAWLIPFFGLPITITGLIMGIKDVKSQNRGLAIAGIVLSSIFLCLTLINAAAGAYQAVTGQHPLINKMMAE